MSHPLAHAKRIRLRDSFGVLMCGNSVTCFEPCSCTKNCGWSSACSGVRVCFVDTQRTAAPKLSRRFRAPHHDCEPPGLSSSTDECLSSRPRPAPPSFLSTSYHPLQRGVGSALAMIVEISFRLASGSLPCSAYIVGAHSGLRQARSGPTADAPSTSWFETKQFQSIHTMGARKC